MTQKGPIILGISVLLCAGACGTKNAAINHPPDVTPVPRVEPSPTQTPARTATVATVAPQQQQQPALPAKQNTVMPQSVRTSLNERLARLEDALFDFNESTIRPDASAALRDDVNVIRDILADYPSQKLIIEGHCDERGSEEYNMALGDRRAAASKEFLSSMGIPQTQLTVISYGKGKPVCTEKTEECWQKNRRAHVTAAP